MNMGVLALRGVQLLDVVGPLDVFAEANSQLGRGAYRPLVIGESARAIRSSSGVRVVPDVVISSRTRFDTLLVAGTPQLPETIERDSVHRFLRRRAPEVRRLGSICTGTFTLARAGLLQGRRVTTHWVAAARLAAAHPELSVDSDRIHVRHGNVYTSAGITAGIDLALALVEDDFGRKLALAVARHMVVFLKRSSGQSQFSAYLAAQTTERSAIEEAQTWCLANLDADLSVPALAKHAGMSARSFARHFRKETDTTPQAFVESARVEAARRLIEETKHSLKEVAVVTGFHDFNTLRRAFVRRLRTTPGEYRDNLRAGRVDAAELRVVRPTQDTRPVPTGISRSVQDVQRP
jgi:transcriptional regulator GlxA family with amidase domain